ncbi:hypothetical protein [Altererythrobacter sp. Z27]|uniref:hypothetical protein n=1 Tax=Altererythrobacter sp. Z27 TaxID=3461147 RepID=UPI0040446F55
MSDVKILHEFRHIFYLSRALLNRKKRPVRTRFWLDKALALKTGSDLYSWVLAADGLHKVNEDRLDDARKAFSESLELSSRLRDEDEQFVYAYSELWLAIGDSKVGYERIKELGLAAQMASDGVSSFLRRLLPLASMERLEEICGHRRNETQPLVSAERDIPETTVAINFVF